MKLFGLDEDDFPSEEIAVTHPTGLFTIPCYEMGEQ